MNRSLFIVLWLTGAVVSWIGVLIYTKCRWTTFTWKEIFEYIKNQKDPNELWKIPLYLVIWPIEIIAAIYRFWYNSYITKRFIKNFPKLDEEES
jgi:hypothetical protein